MDFPAVTRITAPSRSGTRRPPRSRRWESPAIRPFEAWLQCGQTGKRHGPTKCPFDRREPGRTRRPADL